jgi:peptidoglycan/xylan/chitin deacetylase (PgdA/CDA1 family)
MLSSSGSRHLDGVRTAGIALGLVLAIAVAAGASWAAETPLAPNLSLILEPIPDATLAPALAQPEPLPSEEQQVPPEQDQQLPLQHQLQPRQQEATPSPIIRRVDNPDMQIAITFDACATKTHGYGFDLGVYEVLQREQIPATIFVSGRWVEFHPDVMTVLVENPLIEFANHSYDHPHMTKLSSAAIADEIDRTEMALGRHGVRSVAFRPPFGEFSDRVLEIARDRRLPAVLWDVVSGDPSRATTAAGMIRTVVHKTRSGSIVIFHINGRGTKTAPALPSILRQLREQGFQFVHVSTLLAAGEAQKVAVPIGEQVILRPLRRSRALTVATK